MKVFISWSGSTSHKVAVILRDWLPSVIQSIEPYVSSEDIDKGTRWSTDIANELDESSFGVLCVTGDNVNAPWLNFEAGALGKSVDKSRVCPFLFRIKRSEVAGPLLQFQSTIYEKPDVLKLLTSINIACAEDGIEETRLEKAFDVWWPNLQNDLDSIEMETQLESSVDKEDIPQEKPNYIESILEEILELSRTNQKLLRSPEEILPPNYVRELVFLSSQKANAENLLEHPAFEDFIMSFRTFIMKMREIIMNCPKGEACRNEMEKALFSVIPPLEYIVLNSGISSKNKFRKYFKDLLK